MDIAELLRDADEYVSKIGEDCPSQDGGLVKSLAAVLRKQLTMQAKLAEVETIRSHTVADAEMFEERMRKAQADLARERERNRDLSSILDAIVEARNGLGIDTDASWPSQVHQLRAELDAHNEAATAAEKERDRARAELAGAWTATASLDRFAKVDLAGAISSIRTKCDELEQELAREREAHAHTKRGAADVIRDMQDRHAAALKAARAEVERDRLRAQLEPVKVDAQALAKQCAQIYMDAEGSTVTAFMGPVVEHVAQAFARAMVSEGVMRAFDAAYCEIVRHSKTEREIDAALLAGMRAALEHAGLHAVDAGSAFAAKRPSGIAIGTADSTDEAAHVGDVRRLALVVDGLVDEVRRLGGGGR